MLRAAVLEDDELIDAQPNDHQRDEELGEENCAVSMQIPAARFPMPLLFCLLNVQFFFVHLNGVFKLACLKGLTQMRLGWTRDASKLS